MTRPPLHEFHRLHREIIAAMKQRTAFPTERGADPSLDPQAGEG
jgi:hypothetical protein